MSYIIYARNSSHFRKPVQNGLDTKVEKSRKQMKERKNRAKKIRGVKKVRGLSCSMCLSGLVLIFALQSLELL